MKRRGKEADHGILPNRPGTALAAFGMMVFLGACSATPIVTSPSVQVLTEMNPNLRILVIWPLSRFERIDTDAVIEDSEHMMRVYEEQMSAWVKKEATNRAFDVTELSSLDPARVGTAGEKLAALSHKLARGIVPEEARESLNSLAAVDPNLAVLVQYLKVKVGPGWDWNSYTGDLHSTMSNMLIDAALLSCRDGRVLWKNEVLFRDLVMPESHKFMETLTLVYQTFVKK
jgi:hypothetical protein